MGLPLFGRLSSREYFALIVGFTFLVIERLLQFAIFFLPKPVITWFYRQSRRLFDFLSGESSRDPSDEQKCSDEVLNAKDFGELCNIHGYAFEEHVVLTTDGYLLGLHRLPARKGQRPLNPGSRTRKPVVYLHHGLLMNSEVWVALTEAKRCLPFLLVEQGYDVWFGNNRGNKYSRKSLYRSPTENKFWDFSMDNFAWNDIPDSINYILQTTEAKKLSYIGFSQGSAQAFAALSIHPQLNKKVNVFIALAPAMSPAGLAAPLVDGLVKSSPALMFLIFGRKAILSSVTMWQTILYPPIFAKVIDSSLRWLFDWRSENISTPQKIAAYAHLYSYASVKSIVHWFQIMRNAAFHMYDDDVISPVKGSSVGSCHPARFPTRNISTPIVLLYGDSDSLVDIDVMLAQLPDHTEAKRLDTYEHLDILWGRKVHEDVLPWVVKALEDFKENHHVDDGPLPNGGIKGSSA